MLSQIVKYLPDVANHFQFREDIEVKNEDPIMPDVTSNLKNNPQHRNPAFAGGEKATFVELVALARHFHPTVSLFATKILAGLYNCF